MTRLIPEKLHVKFLLGMNPASLETPSAHFKEDLAAYQWEKASRELGIKTFPETVKLVKVEPKKIEFIDMSLKKMGYAPRQILNIH